jgi:hypothetical protein
MAVIIYNRYKIVTVSLPKRLRNGRFTSETTVRRFQKRNGHLDSEALKKIPLQLLESSIYIIIFQGGGDGRGYRII